MALFLAWWKLINIEHPHPNIMFDIFNALIMPLPEPMLTHYQLDPKEQTLLKLE